MKNVLIVGGDMRNVYLADEFSKRDCIPLVAGIDASVLEGRGKYEPDFKKALASSDIIILPLPTTKDGSKINTPLFSGDLKVEDILNYAKKDALIFGAMAENTRLPEVFPHYKDYSRSEDFAILNAVPTSEGAIMELMKILPTTIFSSKFIVTGFGKCARIIAMNLKSLGGIVTVCARSQKDLSFAHSLGFKTVKLNEMHLYLPRADACFNTVPQRIFSSRELDSVKKGTPIIDVASAPGGLDEAEAKIRGVNYLFLPGIPGKYSPVTSGQIIYKTISNFINE